MEEMIIQGGRGKDGTPETIQQLTLRRGSLYAVVGHTGSGKSRLMRDIEQCTAGESMTGRRVFIDGKPAKGVVERGALMAHLGQNMRFVLDVSLRDFFLLHAESLGKTADLDALLQVANEITAEAVRLGDSLQALSGGQTRAVMIADIALICDAPVVLVDEIENAGVDKEKALGYLTGQQKLVLAATHDPHTALMATERIVMAGGAMAKHCQRSEEERVLYETLSAQYGKQKLLQEKLRHGEGFL